MTPINYKTAQTRLDLARLGSARFRLVKFRYPIGLRNETTSALSLASGKRSRLDGRTFIIYYAPGRESVLRARKTVLNRGFEQIKRSNYLNRLLACRSPNAPAGIKSVCRCVLLDPKSKEIRLGVPRVTGLTALAQYPLLLHALGLPLLEPAWRSSVLKWRQDLPRGRPR